MSRRKQSHPKPIKHDESVYENSHHETKPARGEFSTHEDDLSFSDAHGSDQERPDVEYSSDQDDRMGLLAHDGGKNQTTYYNSNGIVKSEATASILPDSPIHDRSPSPSAKADDADNNNRDELGKAVVKIEYDVDDTPGDEQFTETGEELELSLNRDVGGRISETVLRSTLINRRRSGDDENDQYSPQMPISGRKILEKDLAAHLQLPSDVLYLQKEDIQIHGTTSVGWIVCSAIPLPQGSSLGPFQGLQVSPDAVKVGDLIIQMTNKRGQQALLNVAGQSGGWLALLRTPSSSASRNTHVYLEGGRIWCEIVADVDVGTELRATFSFQNEEDDEPPEEPTPRRSHSVPSPEPAVVQNAQQQQQQQQPTHSQQVRQPSPTPGHAALIYGCPFCGVRFSSPRTLQGHLSFYCSKKTSDLIVTPGEKEHGGAAVKTDHPPEEGAVVIKQEDRSLSPVEHIPHKRTPNPVHDSSSLEENHSEQPNESPSFKCKHCSYTAEKLSSLNRHMRIHKGDDRSGSSLKFLYDQQPRSSKMKSPSLETFCQDCGIQFSSIRTYRCHKDHYCAQRRKKENIPVNVIADTPAYAIFPSRILFPRASMVDFQAVRTMVRDGKISISDDDTISGPPTPLVLPSPVLTSSGTMRNAGIALTNVKISDEFKRDTSVMFSPSIRHVRDSEDSNTLESNERKDSLETSERDDESEHEEKRKNGDERPLDLTITKKSASYSKLSRICQEKLTMKRDYHEPCNSSPSSSTSSFEVQVIKSEPDTRSPSSDDQGVIHLNQKLSGNIRELKNAVRIPNSLATVSEAKSQGPIPLQLLPHAAALVPPIAFLPPTSLRHVPSPSEKLPVSPSGISKCNDCNIVFYKHENYLVHRQYYCSGSRRADSSQSDIADDMSQISQEDVVASVRLERKQERDSQQEIGPKKSFSPTPEATDEQSANDVKYKYYCVPCRIKFSNASILAAHKEYYCPAGRDSEQSIVAHASSSQTYASSDNQQQVTENAQRQEFTCSKCRSVFASARLLRLHLCDGGFPCPHCDHMAVTENRLAEHIKVHAPTRAFRCTICGYRGNTARGMRMHGKTHIDEGLDFTDENMLEYHEPALMPVIPTVGMGQNSDSELLRIKNEPYKRRRSRKAYEKFDYPQPKIDIPQNCPLCGQSFPNSESLASHFKVHEIAASQYLAGLMKCLHCDYIGRSPEDLRSHFEINHTKNIRKRSRVTSSEDEDGPAYYNRQKTHISETRQETDEAIEAKVMRRDSPSEVDIKSLSSLKKHHGGNAETLDRESPGPSQDIQSMIPTTVKEEESKHHQENSIQRDHLNFLNVTNIKSERVSPEEIIFRNEISKNARSTKSAELHSPSHEEIPHNNRSSHSSPSQPQHSPRKSFKVGQELHADNFLLNIKEERMTDSPTPESNLSKVNKDDSRNMTNHTNGFPDDSPEPQRAVSTSSQVEDRPTASENNIPWLSPEMQQSGSSKSRAGPSAANFYHHPMSCLLIPSGMPSESFRASEIRSDEAKHYCQDCDIFFSRQATYLAHKKHYCRGVVRAAKKAFVHA